MEQAREAQEKEAGSGLAGTDSARAPVVAVEPTPGDERKAETPAPSAARRPAPAALKMKDEALLRSKTERAASLKEDSAVGSGVVEDKATVDLVLRMRKEKAEKAFSSAVTGPAPEASPATGAARAKSMAPRTLEAKGADPALRKVKHLIEEARGKVFSVDYDKDTGEVVSVHAEIPASQYSFVYEGLSTLGDVQAPAKILPREDRASVELRIRLKAAD